MALEVERETRKRQLNSLIKPNSIYFAHPINTYNTDIEKFLEVKIREFFPYYNIENPNQPHHQINYKLWKEATGSGMKYYFEEVLPKMDAGIGLPFEDGKYGAGIFGELEMLANAKKPIWEINSKGIIKEIKDIKELEALALSIDETRERVYGK